MSTAQTRRTSRMEELVYRCFLDEARAPKPGNVSPDSPGHGMSFAEFERSAEACSAVIAAAGLPVGERIYQARRLTGEAVGCNTNLGMLLLFAPLVAAAERTCGVGGLRALRVALGQVLAGLDPADGEQIFAAIREAAPGGLGTSLRYDVRTAPPGALLLAAMHHARQRDRIARQYVSVGADIFDLGVPRLLHHTRTWNGPAGRSAAQRLAWGGVACYIDFLAAFPDSHVQRRHNRRTAVWLQGEAGVLQRELEHGWEACSGHLAELDGRLKRDGINPGTTADLTAASLLACRLVGLPIVGAAATDRVCNPEYASR